MIKLNTKYSEFTGKDKDYPLGKAIDATSDKGFDGTPIVADLINDINGSHIAMYEKAYGTTNGITGNPDTQKSSQFADAICKYVDDHDAVTLNAAKEHSDARDEAQAEELREYNDTTNEAVLQAAKDYAVAKDTQLLKDANLYAEELAYRNEVELGEKSEATAASVAQAIQAMNDFIAHYCPFPVGATYPQYPGQKSPGTLWKGTSWEPLSYGGAFFRSEGGRAGSFAAEGQSPVLQGGAIQKHYHDIQKKTASGTTGSMNRNQNHSHIFFANDEGADPIVSNDDGTVSGFLSFNHGGDELSLSQHHSWNIKNCIASANTDHEHDFSVTVPRHSTDNFGIEETRPDNYTYRIWVRVA